MSSGQEYGQSHRKPPGTQDTHRIYREEYHESQTSFEIVKASAFFLFLKKVIIKKNKKSVKQCSVSVYIYIYTLFLALFVCSSLEITVGVRLERGGVDDWLVEDKSVLLVPRYDSQLFRTSIPGKEVRVGHCDVATLIVLQGVRQFLQHVGSENVVIQLGTAT